MSKPQAYTAAIPLTAIANGFVIVRMERTGENPIEAPS